MSLYLKGAYQSPYGYLQLDQEVDSEMINIPISAKNKCDPEPLQAGTGGFARTESPEMSRARDCRRNCKHYVVRGGNEPPVFTSALSDGCVFLGPDEERDWEEEVCPPAPTYIGSRYKERFYGCGLFW